MFYLFIYIILLLLCFSISISQLTETNKQTPIIDQSKWYISTPSSTTNYIHTNNYWGPAVIREDGAFVIEENKDSPVVVDFDTVN
jgi:hypothetical protein